MSAIYTATSLAPTAAAANNICLSQTPGAAGNLTINGSLASGGVATLDIARRVLVTTVSDESGKTLTITGTNRYGDSISEVMTGPNATTGYTELDFKTVTQIAVSAAFTGAVTVGTNAIASTAWFPLNRDLTPANTVFEIDITGSFTCACEFTLQDTATTNGPFKVHTNTLGSVTADAVGNFVMPVSAVRLTSSAIGGSAVFRVSQAGV